MSRVSRVAWPIYGWLLTCVGGTVEHRREASTMTQHPAAAGLPESRSLTLGELAAAQGVVPVRDVDELAVDGLWESDEELADFLRDLADSRRSHTG